MSIVVSIEVRKKNVYDKDELIAVMSDAERMRSRESRQRDMVSVRKKTGYIIVIGIMAIMLIMSLVFTFSLGQSFEKDGYIKMVISVLGMLFAAILFISSCFNADDGTGQGYRFASASFLLYINIFLAGIIDMLEGSAEMRGILIALLTITVAILMGVHLLFWNYQCASLPENNARRYFSAALYFLAAVYCVLLVINLFTPVLFTVDASGRIKYTGELIDILFFSLFYLIYLLYILPQHCPLKKKLSLIGFVVFPFIWIILNVVWYIKGIVYSVTSLAYIFLLMSAYVVFFCDYIESKELLLRQAAELAEQEKRQTELQTAVMLSQIRPHFLYNALTAIRNLCKTDPAGAYLALGDFSGYLRTNMDTLGSGRMTSFEKELEHIKTYLALEQMRFGEELTVEYDIRYREFSLPSLTVQPIVENAVRHGATMNEDGGRITIRSRKTPEGAAITVTDNGPGFDPSLPPSDGRNHIGLKNVRDILAATGSGELVIDSVPGSGTTVTIRIWEEGK